MVHKDPPAMVLPSLRGLSKVDEVVKVAVAVRVAVEGVEAAGTMANVTSSKYMVNSLPVCMSLTIRRTVCARVSVGYPPAFEKEACACTNVLNVGMFPSGGVCAAPHRVQAVGHVSGRAPGQRRLFLLGKHAVHSAQPEQRLPCPHRLQVQLGLERGTRRNAQVVRHSATDIEAGCAQRV